jgi:beta-lactamase regulating signal transducer with metallopeptidase domain
VRYLPWLWLVGTPLTFALLATGLVGAERMRRGCQVLEEGPVVQLCRRTANALNITRQVAVGVCDRVATPILIGVVKPLILLPSATLSGWSPDELEMVLLHELAHVRRWDNLANLAQRVGESLLFFHPAVWVVSAWVREEREHCCDAIVVAHTGRPRAYAKTLTALAAGEHAGGNQSPSRGPAQTVISAMAKRHLITRLRHILKKER